MPLQGPLGVTEEEVPEAKVQRLPAHVCPVIQENNLRFRVEGIKYQLYTVISVCSSFASLAKGLVSLCPMSTRSPSFSH